MNLSNVNGLVYQNTFTNIGKFRISVANKSSLQITSNTFDGITNPDPANVSTYGAGVRFSTPAAGMITTVSNNFFSNNYTGIAVSAGGGNMSGLNVHIYSNSFINNTYAAINHAGTGNMEASCNWYGSVNMGVISTKVVGPVIWVPYLVNGSDDQPATAGFQPVPNSCASTVLPISILNFTGRKLASVNHLSWSFNSIVIGSQIFLERSSDGFSFTRINKINNTTRFDDHNFL